MCVPAKFYGGEDGVKQMARFFNRSTSRVELSVKSISLAARGG